MRAEFYLRIARELSDIFNVLGIVDCDKEKGKIIEKKWGIKTFRTIDEFLKFSNPLLQLR